MLPDRYIKDVASLQYGVVAEYASELAFFGGYVDGVKIGLIGASSSLVGSVSSSDANHAPYYYTLKFLNDGLAQSAAGDREIVLTDGDITRMTATTFDERFIPPHVELSARVHAVSTEALTRGDFLLTIAPARAAGTLTSRFTPTASGSGLDQIYRALPAAEGALRVQMSFGPLHPHAENICRVPVYLDEVLTLGEHRRPGETSRITIGDLAITATHDRLHLVSLSRRRVVEPHVFHALSLHKQPPLLARFLAHLPRAFAPAWHQFDWGPHAQLPFLPRVRYRRTILSPARWLLTSDELPHGRVGVDLWLRVLTLWRKRWNCPEVVELRDDRTLRLTLTEPVHATLLLTHVRQHGQGMLWEATPAAQYGWIGGHVHEVALPMVTTRAAAPNPLRGELPRVNNTAGQLPGGADASWLSAKIFTHPERMDEIVTDHLAALRTALGTSLGVEPSCWWLRYHSQNETDHLRLRIRTDQQHYASCTNVIGEWTQRMRQAGMAGRLVLDTYHPEIGRYGDGAAMKAAEDVFVADSVLVSAMLRALPVNVHPIALVVANMVGIVSGLLGDLDEAMTWLAARPVAATPATERAVTSQAIRLAADIGSLPAEAEHATPGWTAAVNDAWQVRADALATYRKRLAPRADLDVVVESLLHMHHNRAIGTARDSEQTCRRLTRQAALAWHARQRSGHP